MPAHVVCLLFCPIRYPVASYAMALLHTVSPTYTIATKITPLLSLYTISPPYLNRAALTRTGTIVFTIVSICK